MARKHILRNIRTCDLFLLLALMLQLLTPQNEVLGQTSQHWKPIELLHFDEMQESPETHTLET